MFLSLLNLFFKSRLPFRQSKVWSYRKTQYDIASKLLKYEQGNLLNLSFFSLLSAYKKRYRSKSALLLKTVKIFYGFSLLRKPVAQ